MISVENIPEKVLADIVLNKISVNFNFLALKIMLTRLQQKVKTHPDPATVNECVAEFKNFLIKFAHLPKTQEDIAKIMKSR